MISREIMKYYSYHRLPSGKPGRDSLLPRVACSRALACSHGSGRPEMTRMARMAILVILGQFDAYSPSGPG